MNTNLTHVKTFHKTFGAPVLDTPQIPDEKRVELRLSLILEELSELAEASGAQVLFRKLLTAKLDELPEENTEKDLVECLDALADIQVVLNGSILEYGLGEKFDDAFAEVQASNMSKACQSEEEAQASQKVYAEKGVEVSYELVNGVYVLYRVPDNKILKSINYNAPHLAPFTK